MSHLLLDTHAFIWLTENDLKLSDVLRTTIDTADLVYLSIASLWEMAIKLQLGKLSLQQDYEMIGAALEDSDILILPISFDDTVYVRNLPLHHRDPFDRILIAQSISNSLAIVSADTVFDAYPVRRVWT
ncbi:type II toxin-antitoxin system VapC family toxin [Leptolyngbya sp. CCY15150]|uniref:type II toxin-antitoxin system VapC family toxin n=1 Tax=Leptolyngbya sp. CCY15150 TaxID=2767772 RepID=UPI00194F6EB8|nr:type II toxin-antitoxin system VapC family toxin [Leptolyngbya sp. CCY15150]